MNNNAIIAFHHIYSLRQQAYDDNFAMYVYFVFASTSVDALNPLQKNKDGSVPC